ncbi:MAG TPA: hypothetical protein VFZ40_01925, partial [Pyrinomonadaceae bacterium]
FRIANRNCFRRHARTDDKQVNLIEQSGRRIAFNQTDASSFQIQRCLRPFIQRLAIGQRYSCASPRQKSRAGNAAARRADNENLLASDLKAIFHLQFSFLICHLAPAYHSPLDPVSECQMTNEK